MTNHSQDLIAPRLRRRPTGRGVLLLGGAGALALVLAACGGNTSATTDPNATAAPSQAGPRPGVSGKIAANDGGVLQVQNTDSQTAVAYAADTAITAQVPTTLAAVTVGSCVVVTSATSTAATDATPSATAPIDAVSVEIAAPAADGTCSLAAGFGGAGAAGGFGGNGPRPSGSPNASRTPPNGGNFGSNRPSAFPSGTPGNFRNSRAVGTVSSVSGNTLVVNEIILGGRGQGGSANPSPVASPTFSTQPRTINLSASTTYLTTQKATSAALVVGKCAVVQGKADSSGTVAATAIDVTDAVNGSCFGGFGGIARRGPGGGGQIGNGGNASG